ncbi:MAG: hypothetical protein QOJ32_3352 [Frankiaceae bacterium]|nr:hypothetical protein [Frankiaceae bacterium]
MTAPSAPPAAAQPPSVYERLLRLRHLRLRPWQREALTWGVLVLATLLAMTGLVSPWVILLLPLLVSAAVKLHDLATPRLEAAAHALTPLELPGTTEPPVG